MISMLLSYLQSSSGDPSGAICPIIVIVAIILIAVAVSSDAKKKAKTLATARDAYHNSLRNLKANPTDPSLRQLTLGLGRNYSNLTRNKKGVTIFDEVALSNDISAACAGAANIFESNVQKPDQTIELRLEKLAELKAKGLIDDNEYAARREKVLDEV